MNPTAILDTSAVIHLFKGTSREVCRAVMNSSRLVIPLATYAELLAGIVRRGEAANKERALLEDLLATPGTSVHHPDEETGRFYAKIFDALRKQGTMIPTNDIWIAAEVMSARGILYSSDRHFETIPFLDWRYCD